MWLSAMLALAAIAAGVGLADVRSLTMLGPGRNEAWVEARARDRDGDGGGGMLVFGFNAAGRRIEVRVGAQQE